MTPLVGIVMGSQSDWPTLREAAAVLTDLGVAHEARVVSAHRTPDRLWAYGAEAAGRGLRVIVAGAGGAAHLPGMMASKTLLPVIGVPIETRALGGIEQAMDSILRGADGFSIQRRNARGRGTAASTHRNDVPAAGGRAARRSGRRGDASLPPRSYTARAVP